MRNYSISGRVRPPLWFFSFFHPICSTDWLFCFVGLSFFFFFLNYIKLFQNSAVFIIKTFGTPLAVVILIMSHVWKIFLKSYKSPQKIMSWKPVLYQLRMWILFCRLCWRHVGKHSLVVDVIKRIRMIIYNRKSCFCSRVKFI